jgi:hypothetical protein
MSETCEVHELQALSIGHPLIIYFHYIVLTRDRGEFLATLVVFVASKLLHFAD